jgi:hypothetical protein
MNIAREILWYSALSGTTRHQLIHSALNTFDYS